MIIINGFAFLQAFSILSEAKDEDARKRLGLLGLYNAAEKCLNKVDDKILHLLQQNLGNVKEKLHSHKVEIAHKEYFLLVAGKIAVKKIMKTVKSALLEGTESPSLTGLFVANKSPVLITVGPISSAN